MKALIAIAIIVGAAFGGHQIYSYWVNTQAKEKEQKRAVQSQRVTGAELPGLPPTLEGPLQLSQQKGAEGLRTFLRQYGPTISDPRKASIELDYVVLVAREDIAEARKVFARVKQRTTPTSPVYSRMKQLEKTYE